MSFLEDMKNKAAGAIGGIGGEHSGLIHGLMEMLTHQESGGLAGLLQGFQQKGLGEIVSSWIGKGENWPISPDQVQQALGPERIGQLADQTGLSPESVRSRLAEVLPGLVDKLTPEGKIPEGSRWAEQGLSFLRDQFLK